MNASKSSSRSVDKLTKHHRRPKYHGGNSGKKNISLVLWSVHVAYHALFGVRLPSEVAEELNLKWGTDEKWIFVAVTKKVFERKKRREDTIRTQIERMATNEAKSRSKKLKKTLTQRKQDIFRFFFGNKNPEEIAEMLTEIWIDPEWIIFAVYKDAFTRKR